MPFLLTSAGRDVINNNVMSRCFVHPLPNTSLRTALTNGINKNPDELIGEAKFMVTYMMEKREVEIKNLIIEEVTTTVKEIASVVASVVYLEV